MRLNFFPTIKQFSCACSLQKHFVGLIFFISQNAMLLVDFIDSLRLTGVEICLM